MGLPVTLETMESIPDDGVTPNQPDHGHGGTAKDPQTAADFIDEQLALEADAREVLPFKFDKCTHDLGPLRQDVYACLTCSPPPASAAQLYTPAGICYACSISCHGEHHLVELFQRRNFVCDCGTTRLPSNSPCMLRPNPEIGRRGVNLQKAADGNSYNHNFQNTFCACGEEYDAEQEKGTMFQCIGLGTVESGGCGEDWYHPECLMGLPRDWSTSSIDGQTPAGQDTAAEVQDHPVPPGFPQEDDFDAFVCYKCVAAYPWIKKYAGTAGFLPPVHRRDSSATSAGTQSTSNLAHPSDKPSLKRKASDEDVDAGVRSSSPSKRVKDDASPTDAPTSSFQPQPSSPKHKHSTLPPAAAGTFSIFLREDFRDQFCHCPSCYPNLLPHPQLVEEEDAYEPSVSNNSGASDHRSNPLLHSQNGSDNRSHRSGSLLERGEAALNNVDRVRAIEGVMVYNHLKDKVKEFLKPYAESGKPVSADDIKSYFEKLRGDEQGIKEAGERAEADGDDADGDDAGGGDDAASGNRREQSGY